MIVRDVDVLQAAAARADVSVNFSVPTLDPEVWRTTEPGTAPPRQRLRALKTLVDAGIKAGVGMAPILPGLSDRPEQLEAGRAGRARGGRDPRLGERAQPAARDARALPRAARPRLARGARALRAALRRPGLPERPATPRSRVRASPRCGPVTASPTGASSAVEPPATAEQLALAV